MSSGPETSLSNAVRRALAGPRMDGRGGLRCIVVKTHGSKFFPIGFPDLIVIRPDGVTCFVEVKVPGRSDGPAGDGLSAKQLEWLWRLASQGCRAGSACSVDEVVGLVFG